MIIREAGARDAGEMLTLQRAAWVSEAQLHDSIDLPPLSETLDELRTDLDSQTALVAVDGHRIVGMVRAHLKDATWVIMRLGVAPDRQGEGIGTRLLAAIEDAAPGHVRQFELFTGPKSLRNIALYERHGYQRFETTDRLVHLRKGRTRDA